MKHGLKRSYLLDTQAILDIRAGAPVPASVRSLFSENPFGDNNDDMYLSVASIWEIAIKSSNKSALELGVTLREFVESAVANGIVLLDIKPSHLYELQTLPYHHKDPFDRLIVAQAKCEGLVVVGKDRKFDDYGIQRVW